MGNEIKWINESNKKSLLDIRNDQARKENSENFDKFCQIYIKSIINERDSIHINEKYSLLSIIDTSRQLIQRSYYDIKIKKYENKMEKCREDMAHNLELVLEIEEEKRKFDKIDLNKYKNKDGSYTITKLERPIKSKESKFFGLLNNLNSKVHHEGISIGNEKNHIIIDYGKKDNRKLQFEIKESTNLDEWETKTEIQKKTISDKKLKETILGKDIEDWSSRKDYDLISHNCQDFVKNVIQKVNENK